MNNQKSDPGPDTPTWLHAEAVIAGRLLIIGLALAAALWVVLQVQFIASATVLGFAMVALLWPLAKWLRKKGVPDVAAALACVLLFLAFFIGLVVFVVDQVIDSGDSMVEAITGSVEALGDWLEEGPFGLESTNIQDLLDELQTRLDDILGGVSSAAATGLTALGNLTTVVLIATFFTIFALTSGDRLWFRFVATLRPEHQAPATAAFRSSMRAAGNWFYASTLTGLVDGLLIGGGLTILDVPLAIPIGALTFIMGYVPMVGATLAGAVAVAVALFSGGFSDALWALALVLVVQQIEGNVLSPLLLSRAVNFHPLIILLLTTGAATAFGLVGLFLAVPVAGSLTAGIRTWKRATRKTDPGGDQSPGLDTIDVLLEG